jgi:hypothetical protein
MCASLGKCLKRVMCLLQVVPEAAPENAAETGDQVTSMELNFYSVYFIQLRKLISSSSYLR